MTTPQLVQMIASSCNPLSYYGDVTGNNFAYTLPNANFAGNAMWVFCSWPSSASAPTISDNINGTWPSAKATLAGGAGKQSVSFHLITGIAAGVTTVTATFGSAIGLFQWDIGVHSNITGFGSAQGAAAVAGPTLATGSFTPPNNNANGGNLILSYFSNNVQTTTAVGPSPWVAGSGHTLLEADATGLWSGATGNLGGFNHATQYDLQTTSAAINPGMTATGDTTYAYNCLAVALTVGTAGQGPPSTGIYVVKIIHQSIPALGGSDNTTATTAAIQVPWTGNLRFCYGTTANTGGNVILASMLTDSDAYTWTNWSAQWPNTNAPTGQSLWGYAENTTADPNATLTIATGTGFNGYCSFAFFDIANAAAAAFDNFQGDFIPANLNDVSAVYNFPVITPFVNKGLTIAGSGLAVGPGLSVVSPVGGIFDYIGYTGQSDGSNFDNSNVCGHYYFNSNAIQNWGWTITPVGGDSGGGTGAITFASADATERIWWIGDGAYTSSTGGASVTLPYPSGVVAGDMLLAVLATQTGAATGGGITTPSGWTFVGSGPNCHDTAGGNWNQVYLYSKVFASGTSQVFAPLSTANLDGIVRAYRGLTGTPTINAFASSRATTNSGATTTNVMPTIIEAYQPGEIAVYAAINDSNQVTGWDTLVADVNGGGMSVGGGSNNILLSDYNWNFQPGQIVFKGGGGYGSGVAGVTVAPPAPSGSAGTSSGSAAVSSLRDPDVAIKAWFNENVLPGTEWFDKNQPEPTSSIIALVARLFAAITGRTSNQGTAGLSASSEIEVKSHSVLYGNASLSARSSADVSARGAVAGSAALAAKSAAQVKGSTNPLYGTAGLASRATIAIKSLAYPVGSLALAARAAIAVMERGVASGIAPLAGIIFAKVKAFSAPVGNASLAARTAIKVMSRGALSASGALTSMISVGAIQFKALGQLAGSAALSARSGLAAKARGALSASGALTSIISTGAIQFKALGQLAGVAALSARSGMMVKAKSGFNGLASLSAIARVAVRASGAPSAIAPLAGIVAAKFKAFSAPVGSASLAARAAIKITSRSVLSAGGALTSIISTGAIQFKAMGKLAGTAALSARSGFMAKSASGLNGRLPLSAVANAAIRAGGTMAGRVSLAARAAIQIVARGAVAGGGTLTSIMSMGAIQFKATGQLVRAAAVGIVIKGRAAAAWFSGRAS